MKNAKYFQLVSDGDEKADLYIFGDICAWAWPEYGEQSGVTIVEQLKALTAKNITVHINSYGGDVAEGLAIYNVLKNHEAAITTICDGFACSAASVVFMAGEKRVMNRASLLMVHNAWTIASGNAAQLRKAADDIETITGASIEAYKSRCSIDEDKIRELMDAETWITAEEAKEWGFATDVEDDDEDDDDPKQSAFSLIRDAILSRRGEEDLVWKMYSDGRMLIRLDGQGSWSPMAMELDATQLVAGTVSAETRREAAEEKTDDDEFGWTRFFGKGEKNED